MFLYLKTRFPLKLLISIFWKEPAKWDTWVIKISWRLLKLTVFLYKKNNNNGINEKWSEEKSGCHRNNQILFRFSLINSMTCSMFFIELKEFWMKKKNNMITDQKRGLDASLFFQRGKMFTNPLSINSQNNNQCQ